jgi:hypothetical protein
MKNRSASDTKTIRSLLALLAKKGELRHLRWLVRQGASLASIAEWVNEYVRGPAGFEVEQRFFKRMLAAKGWDVAHYAARDRRVRLAPPEVRAVLVPHYAADDAAFGRAMKLARPARAA